MTEHESHRFEVRHDVGEDFTERCKRRAEEESHYQATGETVSSVAVKATISIEE